MPLSEIELLGMKLKLNEVSAKQGANEKALATHDRLISDLVTYSMSASIFRHLCGIGLLKEYKLCGNEGNRREFYFLRDNGFIAPKTGGFAELCNDVDTNLSAIAEPTPIGWNCIKLRTGEIPTEWLTLEKRWNLAVDPASIP